MEKNARAVIVLEFVMSTKPQGKPPPNAAQECRSFSIEQHEALLLQITCLNMYDCINEQQGALIKSMLTQQTFPEVSEAKEHQHQ